MRRLGLVLACLVVALFGLGGGAALAGSGSGCPGSAGDSQYVDPLGCPTHSTTTSPPPTSSNPPPTTTSQTPSATVATTTVATTTPSTAKDPKKSLPHTGLDIWAAVALGLGLLGGGIVLRRSVSAGRSSA